MKYFDKKTENKNMWLISKANKKENRTLKLNSKTVKKIHKNISEIFLLCFRNFTIA